MRVVQLGNLEAGISRLRVKGGASTGNLYDLLNGYVTLDGGVESRPGTDGEIILPAGTKGLCAANGRLVVFSARPVEMPRSTPQVVCAVLRHPKYPRLELADIHYAGPFLGDKNGAILYVVAEFTNGDVFHFWQRTANPWSAEASYADGDVVQPTNPNGYMYIAHPSNAGTKTEWAAGVSHSVGDIVVPTVPNGYYYEAIEVSADPTPSGSVEPTWPAEDGAVVYEFTYDAGGSATTAPPSGGAPPGGSLPDDVIDRYKNLKGVMPL